MRRDRILTVLQAYAWRHYDAFKDDDTNRVLRTLKPELLPTSGSELPDSSSINTRTSGEAPRSTYRSQDERHNGKKSTTTTERQKDAVRRAIQEQHMTRLAAPSGLADAAATTSHTAVFTCQDGVTTIPYTVAGHAASKSRKCNLVVFHDLFDTMDSTTVFFRSILARNVGARALFFNFPGQAGAAYAATSVLNNVWLARRVHELLNFLQHTKQFMLTTPFHLIGFGNGANIATCYAVLHGKAYDGHLQSLVLCNGFASVDAQLAAILHSAVNVFACFPPTRPDLPVSFFAKFLFSDAYLAKVDANLALSIYTAVTNAMSLDGRVRTCQGALRHIDLVSQLTEIDVPLVLVQSVESALVAPTNVDPFLQSRANVLHAWSHQQQPHALTSDGRGKTSKQLRQVLTTPKSAFVSWLRAGHELRQECKAYVTDLMELLVNAKEPLGSSTEHEVGPTLSAVMPAKPVGGEPFTTSSLPTGGSSGTASMRLRVAASHSSMLVSATPVIHDTTAVSIAALPSTATKSAYELQLERSEREFQDAVKTHEAQKAELAKKRRLTRPQLSSEAVHASLQSASSPVQRQLEPSISPPTLPTSRLPHLDASQLPVLLAGLKQPHAAQERGDAVKAASVHTDIDDAIRQRMAESEAKAAREAEELRAKQQAVAAERLAALQHEQEQRRRAWEAEDRARAAAMERTRQAEQATRLKDARKKRDSVALLEEDLLVSSLRHVTIDTTPVVASFAQRLQQQKLQQQLELQQPVVRPPLSGDALREQIRQQPDLPSVFDQLEVDERAKKRLGQLQVDDFETVRASMSRTYNDSVRKHDTASDTSARRRQHALATRIQAHVRRWLAARHVSSLCTRVQQERVERFAGSELVRLARGFLGRRQCARHRVEQADFRQRAFAACVIQRVFRGHVARVAFGRKRRDANARVLQRVFRGYIGRQRCIVLRDALAQRRYLDRNACTLQATWRMHVAREQFLAARVSVVAATELQRVYRGHIGRVEAARRKQWRDAEPGPERLALGLQLLEGSKQAFARQQRELDALHRAQEAAERQVSTVHTALQESETELAGLERELQELDQLERDLCELTHEAERLHRDGVDGLGRQRSEDRTQPSVAVGSGVPTVPVPYEAGVETLFESKTRARTRQADAYAVEMAVQIKRMEREQRKQALEADFAGVFADVQQKRETLARMESALADMEATRLRKDREFARLQRRLVELLEEQKLELERLREKGIELEAATATSAAAAAATAAKAQAHEARSQALFASTEELMKFQFMSMSLSYFSSLTMLQSLRDMNADTTAAAVTSTAETAATAAAAAAAASIPAMHQRQLLKGRATDVGVMTAVAQAQELQRQQADEAARAPLQPLPPTVSDWSVDDVGRWLETLALPQYKPAFAEGAVDGPFLLELRPEDLADVLGVRHALHVRKVIAARNKLLPLTTLERQQLRAVEHEADAAQTRTAAMAPVVPALDTVFSQARNGRLKRLAESLDAGFPVDDEDEKGNTLLLVACQNGNAKMVEYLVTTKRANVNHRNAQGNTPLHFAMAYDAADGALGEYLIAHGADDTLENTFGLTAYDGLTPE